MRRCRSTFKILFHILKNKIEINKLCKRKSTDIQNNNDNIRLSHHSQYDHITVAYKIIVELNELKHFQNQFLLLFLKNKKINLLKRYFFVAIRKSLRHTETV
uniref:Uncharacterized protein n=1 Tax=Bartonella rochalimae ATCC BAA-1498 TaxID=685782 RepID=E6YNN8_9HYPH|nr:hypothetical protein BARRO_130120 [Bartonella rochalimae ATCC BAA-1498]